MATMVHSSQVDPNSPPEKVAMDDLLEVESCLRDMLQSTSDPAVLQRLFNLHREIQRYISELNTSH